MSDSPATSPRWLWITAEIAAELTTGRLVYSTELLRAVANEGVAVTVVGRSGPPASTPFEHAGISWHAVPAAARGGVRSLLSSLPNLAYASAVPAVRRHVDELLGQHWDVVVIDHLQSAWVAGQLARRNGASVVFVTHNHEASVRRRVADETPSLPRRLVLTVDSAKAGRLERRAASAVDVVSTITESDRDLFEADHEGLRTVVIPPGWSGSPPPPPSMEVRPRRVGVLGSFDWHVKQENLERFLRAAGDILASADVEVVVGGSAPEDFVRRLEGGSAPVRFVGWVDDVAPFLHGCRIGLIAEPLGGGFKLKSLDYVFHGLPVAGIAGSVSGLPLVAGQSMIEASDARTLAAAVVDAIDRPAELERIASAAERACAPQFSWTRRAQDLIRALSQESPG